MGALTHEYLLPGSFLFNSTTFTISPQTASSKKDGIRSYRVKDMKVKEALEGKTHGGTLVIADTQAQVINKACKGEICFTTR